MHLVADIREIVEQIGYVDHERGTDINTHVRGCIAEVNQLRDQLSQSEFEELLGDKLQLIELDEVLSVDEDLRLVQGLLRRLPGLISSVVFA